MIKDNRRYRINDLVLAVNKSLLVVYWVLKHFSSTKDFWRMGNAKIYRWSNTYKLQSIYLLKAVTKFNQRQFSKCYKCWDIWSLFEPVQILKLKNKLYTVHCRMPREPWIHRNSFLHNLFMWWHSRTNSDVVRKKCNR